MTKRWGFAGRGLAATGMLLVWAFCLESAHGETAGVIKVLRVLGAARYSSNNKTWHELKKGDVLHAGVLIQTAQKSRVDLDLGESPIPSEQPVINGTLYTPEEKAENILRLLESSALSVDKFTRAQTSVELVEEIKLNVHIGAIMGSVSKLASASRYEIGFSNGVATIRGTMYVISHLGVVKVMEGKVMLTWTEADGTVKTKLVSAGYRFDPTKDELIEIQEPPRPPEAPPQTAPLVTVIRPSPIIYISPINGK